MKYAPVLPKREAGKNRAAVLRSGVRPRLSRIWTAEVFFAAFG